MHPFHSGNNYRIPLPQQVRDDALRPAEIAAAGVIRRWRPLHLFSFVLPNVATVKVWPLETHRTGSLLLPTGPSWNEPLVAPVVLNEEITMSNVQKAQIMFSRRHRCTAREQQVSPLSWDAHHISHMM